MEDKTELHSEVVLNIAYCLKNFSIDIINLVLQSLEMDYKISITATSLLLDTAPHAHMYADTFNSLCVNTFTLVTFGAVFEIEYNIQISEAVFLL